MNSENEIVQFFSRFSKHGKKADGWKPAIICYTRIRKKLFPSTKGGGRRGESRELLRVGTGESSALQQLIQIILVLQQGLPQNGQLKKSTTEVYAT